MERSPSCASTQSDWVEGMEADLALETAWCNLPFLHEL